MAFVQALPRRLASWIAAEPDWGPGRSTGMLALVASVPSPLMVWWAVGFTALTLVYAIRAFRRRAL